VDREIVERGAHATGVKPMDLAAIESTMSKTRRSKVFALSAPEPTRQAHLK
jgi:hypothetical protein